MTILNISDFLSKKWFWEVTGHSGILEISVFLLCSRFSFFWFVGAFALIFGPPRDSPGKRFHWGKWVFLLPPTPPKKHVTRFTFVFSVCLLMILTFFFNLNTIIEIIFLLDILMFCIYSIRCMYGQMRNWKKKWPGVPIGNINSPLCISSVHKESWVGKKKKKGNTEKKNVVLRVALDWYSSCKRHTTTPTALRTTKNAEPVNPLTNVTTKPCQPT